VGFLWLLLSLRSTVILVEWNLESPEFHHGNHAVPDTEQELRIIFQTLSRWGILEIDMICLRLGQNVCVGIVVL
jgi:hypothetical protein